MVTSINISASIGQSKVKNTRKLSVNRKKTGIALSAFKTSCIQLLIHEKCFDKDVIWVP